jgi:hypothetical protein
MSAALAGWAIASLDKNGNMRLGEDAGFTVLLVFPYGVIAAAALWNRRSSFAIGACLVTAATIAIAAISIQWSDYELWRSMPPNYGLQQTRIAAILLIEWLGCSVLVALAVVHHMLAGRNPPKSTTAR